MNTKSDGITESRHGFHVNLNGRCIDERDTLKEAAASFVWHARMAYGAEYTARALAVGLEALAARKDLPSPKRAVRSVQAAKRGDCQAKRNYYLRGGA